MLGSICSDLCALFSGERQGLGARRELWGWFSQALGRSYPVLSRAAVHTGDGCLCVATLGHSIEACKASSLSRAAAKHLGGSAVLPTRQRERGKRKKKKLFGAAKHPVCRHSSGLQSHREPPKYYSSFPTVASLLFFLIACDAIGAY